MCIFLSFSRYLLIIIKENFNKSSLKNNVVNAYPYKMRHSYNLSMNACIKK